MTQPQLLFSIKYGNLPSNIGIVFLTEENEENSESEITAPGISDFTVDLENNFYIADKVNGRIKKFNSKGKLIGVTEDCLQSIEYVAVDPKGNIFVLYWNPSIHIAIYNTRGIRKKDEEEKIKNILPGLTINYIRFDLLGNLYLFRERYVDSEPLY